MLSASRGSTVGAMDIKEAGRTSALDPGIDQKRFCSVEVATPAVGHSRPRWSVRAMSGLPPLATELRTSLVVRFAPRTDVSRRLAWASREQLRRREN